VRRGEDRLDATEIQVAGGLADDIGANAPERLLVDLGFFAFAVSAFVGRADEAALDKHVRLWPARIYVQ
jgi:hypothetical protein